MLKDLVFYRNAHLVVMKEKKKFAMGFILYK